MKPSATHAVLTAAVTAAERGVDMPTTSQLAASIGCTPANISMAVSALVRKGVLRRVSAGGRRRVLEVVSTGAQTRVPE